METTLVINISIVFSNVPKTSHNEILNSKDGRLQIFLLINSDVW